MSIQPTTTGGSTEPFLVAIGNIRATEHQLVTPVGTWPIADVNIATVDQTSTTTRTPTWAVILAITLVWFFLLSLLFLLAKESRLQGYIAVTVTTPRGQSYVEQVPVADGKARLEVFNRVTYLQNLIGRERARVSW